MKIPVGKGCVCLILWPQPSPASISHCLLISLVSLAHGSIFICLFVFLSVCIFVVPASCQAVCFSLASAQAWLLSFWSPSIPDVGKTSVLSSCLVLADSQTAAAVPGSCMGLDCMHRAGLCQAQKTHRGSPSLQNHPPLFSVALHQVQRRQMRGFESGRVCAVSKTASTLGG